MLPEVINALLARGYTVTGTNATTQPQHQYTASYQLEPGPATLTAQTDHDGGRIQLTLTGPTFGKQVHGHDTDPVIWMNLVVLGVRLREAYSIDDNVTDPDLVEHNNSPAADTALAPET